MHPANVNSMAEVHPGRKMGAIEMTPRTPRETTKHIMTNAVPSPGQNVITNPAGNGE
jgi:hypothetical protein